MRQGTMKNAKINEQLYSRAYNKVADRYKRHVIYWSPRHGFNKVLWELQEGTALPTMAFEMRAFRMALRSGAIYSKHKRCPLFLKKELSIEKLGKYRPTKSNALQKDSSL